MNKGRIHGKIKFFWRTSWNSIKSNNELRWEIRNFNIFGKRTQIQIHLIKNFLIWIKICGEIKEQKKDRKSIAKREKSEIKSKINLIYESKLQSNDTGWKIRRKTHNLTQDSTWNDPIDREIKTFSFCDFEDDSWHSWGKFSLIFWRNLTFNYFLNAEMSLQVKGRKRFKDSHV